MSAVRVDRPARQQHVGSPLQPLSPPGGGADPGWIVTVGSGGDRFVQPFLLFPLLNYDDPLEAYDTLMKKERGSDEQFSPPWPCRHRCRRLLAPRRGFQVATHRGCSPPQLPQTGPALATENHPEPPEP